MLFQTQEFVKFFILFFFGYLILYKSYRSLLPLFTLIGSYYFYAAGGLYNLPIIFLSTTVNYFLATALNSLKNQSAKKATLIFGLAANVGLLIIFKYGSRWSWPVALPLGMSFYTFHSLSYLIDIYKGKPSYRKNFVDFCLYIAFFPQLIAGPITRGEQFFKSYDHLKVSRAYIAKGLACFCIGLIKKILIADKLSLFLVEPIFNSIASQSFSNILIGGIAFNIQVYFDFSGYCDMAIGLAAVLGFDLPINFDKPFLAKTVTEHWRRWHMTLSFWVRDYIYFPLGGSRQGRLRKFFNISVAMLAIAFWHDVTWGALYWGVYTLAAMILSYLIEEKMKKLNINFEFPFFISALSTVFVLSFGRLLYKLDTTQILSVLNKLKKFNSADWVSQPSHLGLAFLVFLVLHHYWARLDLKDKLLQRYLNTSFVVQILVFAICVYSLIFTTHTYQSFIYHKY